MVGRWSLSESLLPVTSGTGTLTEDDQKIAWELVAKGDLQGLNVKQRLSYTLTLCRRLNLDPMTGPFQFIKLNGKEVLYATRQATEQLRKLHRVSLKVVNEGWMDDGKEYYRVRVEATTPDGRADTACGVASIYCGKNGAKGTAAEIANVPMKAETKAKRRATLSICGLGFLDESEIETTAAGRKREDRPARNDQIDDLARLSTDNDKFKLIQDNLAGYKKPNIRSLTESEADFILTLLEE
jgi:hypothetical protein